MSEPTNAELLARIEQLEREVHQLKVQGRPFARQTGQKVVSRPSIPNPITGKR